MEILKAIILGIVQGLTEFLPVSSTAHLILFPWFFSWHGELNTLTFDVALHGGTLLSLMACFYKDWLNIFFRDRKTLLFIMIATIPAGTAGILFDDFVEHSLRSPLIIVFTLAGFGILMLVADRISKKQESQINLSTSLFIGCAQAIALIPGVSRSGITITAGLFRNLTRESAARFSFLLSTPVIAGATILESKKLIINPASYDMSLFFAGFLSAFVSGYFAINFLLGFLKRHSLDIFVYYRFLLAGIILAAYLI